MWRAISRAAVTSGGLVLAAWGLAAMWQGWDQIQIERGWSLFIGGAAALAGGAVTASLGQVLARLDRLILTAETPRQAPVSPPAKQWVAPPPPAPKNPESQPAQQRPAAPKPEPPPPAAEDNESEEVDRYVSGDTTYVMFADGAVEVSTPDGAQRYASLAELRAQAAARG
jgi:hypothetical protein